MFVWSLSSGGSPSSGGGDARVSVHRASSVLNDRRSVRTFVSRRVNTHDMVALQIFK